MSVQVKLKDIIEELEVQMEGFRTFLHTKTGEIITVSEDELRAAEEEEEIEYLPNWQKENLKIAYDVTENFEDYEELPTKFEINEYEMMEEFCLTIQDQMAQDMLLTSLRGKGAFRRFKDKVINLGIEDRWYSFREECLKEVAIKWCQDYNFCYIE